MPSLSRFALPGGWASNRRPRQTTQRARVSHQRNDCGATRRGERPRLAGQHSLSFVISSLRGTIEAQTPGFVVIDVAGVGYGVHVTPTYALSLAVGESAHLVITTIVREDAITLYGFESRESGQIFDTLLSVTGVGPRSALAVLSQLTPAQVFDAVANDDDKAFTRVTGIGPKTAKLICVQLAGRLAAVSAHDAVVVNGEKSSPGDAVVAALVGLGWSERLARDTMADVETVGKTTSQLLREALALMARQS